MTIKSAIKSWWKWLRYEPNDPRFNAGGMIKIAVIGGGTGLATLLRGLKKYSNDLSAIVTVTDNGGDSTALLRKEFDIIAPGDIRQCISALAEDEKLFSELFEYRFDKDKKNFGGHTLGNIWITALTSYFGSFDRAIEVTSQMFKTAGKVLPSTLENITLKVTYEDGSELVGESHLDEVLKKIQKVSLTKDNVKAYPKAVEALLAADLILIGPGSLYGSLIPNLLVPGIREAIIKNERAKKIYIMNCSTERTQTPGYSVEDHMSALIQHCDNKVIFDYCLVNNKVIKLSKNDVELGEVNNITTKNRQFGIVKIYSADVISRKNPLYHDKDLLAKAVIELYNKAKDSRGKEEDLIGNL